MKTKKSFEKKWMELLNKMAAKRPEISAKRTALDKAIEENNKRLPPYED